MSINASPQIAKQWSPWVTRLATSSWFPCLLFGGVCLLGILNHEMWGDELRAWMLVQQSSSLVELFAQISREGHPALWYFFLYGLQRFTSAPLAMQLAHGAIATLIIYLIHRYSPFTQLQRWLLTFSYFFFYEYAIISRGYGLGVLCLLSFCSLMSGPKRNPLLLAGALALLANTSAYGLLLSFSFALVWAWAWWQQRGQNSPARQLRNGLGGLLILLMGWGTSVFQVTRSMVAQAQESLEQTAILIASNGHNASILPAPESTEASKRLIYSLIQIWKAYVPIPVLGQSDFWNTNFITNWPLLDVSDRLPLGLGLSVVLSGVMAFLALKSLGRSPLLACIYTLGTASLLLFSFQFAWWTSLRHHGHLFMLLVACFWLLPHVTRPIKPGSIKPGSIKSASGLSRPASGFQRKFFNVLLVFQVFAGLYLYASDLTLPFAGGKAAAAYIESQGLSDLPLVGYKERRVAIIAAYLDKPIYSPERQGWIKHWVNAPPAENNFSKQLDDVVALAERSAQDVLLIWSQPLESEIPGYDYTTLGVFEPQLMFDDETFYLYRLSRS